MTDYTKATGYNGTMMIRDTGTTVEFWLKAGSTTSNGGLPWRYTINGTTSGWLSFDFNSGGAYQRLGAWTISSDQTVTFYLGDSGTSGLGGPTTFSVAIVRDSVPDPPSKPTVTSIGPTTATVKFTGGDNGGLAVDNYRVWYGKTSAASDAYVNNVNGSAPLTGLIKGTTYYTKVTAHNAKGYGAYSAVTSFKTLIEPPAPSTPVISEIGQSTAKVVFTGNGSGGAASVTWQLAYGTSTDVANATIISSTGTSNLINLQPGATYYFWARGINSVGTGAWSGRASAMLRAGARIFVNQIVHGTLVPVPNNAVPYVRYNGVWYPAVPRVKISGMWKETG